MYSVAARKLLLNKTLTNIGGVASLAISPDGLHLFLTDTAQVASLSTSTLQATGSLSIQTLTLASAGNVLLAGGYSGLYLIDESTLTQQTLLSTDGLPSTIYVSADGTTALLVEQSNCSLGLTCALQIVNVPLQSITATDGNQSNPPVILSPDGNQITVFGVTDPLFKGSTGINFTETIDAQTFAVLQRGPLLSYLTPVYAGSTLFLYCWTNLVSIVDGSSQTVTAQIPIGSASVELAVVPGRNVVDAFTGYGLDIIERRKDTVRPSLALTLGSYTAFGVSATAIYGVGTSAVLSIDPITGQQRFLTPPNFPQPPDCFMTLGTPVVSPDQTKMIIATGNLCGPPPNYKMSLLPDESVAGLAIYNASNNTLIAQVSAFSSGTPIFSPDSAIAYLPNSYYPGGLNPSQINVIDLATAAITGVWSLPENLEIGDMVISPDGKTVYALSESDVDGSGALLAIDTGSGTLVDQIPLPTTAGSLAIAPDGSKLLITGFGGTNTNSLGVMDAVTGVISFVDTGSPTGSLVATN